MYNLLKYKIRNLFVTFEIVLGYNAVLVLFVNLCNAIFIKLVMPMATIVFFGEKLKCEYFNIFLA